MAAFRGRLFVVWTEVERRYGDTVAVTSGQNDTVQSFMYRRLQQEWQLWVNLDET
jgi:hypothetical protein